MTARRKPDLPTLVDTGPESSLVSIESELTQIQRDAAEFGSHYRQGGWRLGMLVARSVQLGSGGPRDNCSQVNGSPAKVSMRRFSELSGVSLANVSYHYKAWELAAEDGRCTRAKDLVPGQDDLADQMDEDDDELRCDWAKYMKKARDTKKPIPKKDPVQTLNELSADEPDEDSDLDDSTEVEAEISSSKPEVQLTRDEIVQADSQIQRMELLEVLESARALISRISRIGHVEGDSAVYMGQIASAALDLNTTANALAMQKESQPKRAAA